jgi:DNA-binding XRE family transcriptional regulator
LRQRLGLSRVEFARCARISATQLGAIEDGAPDCAVHTIGSIARAGGVTVESLLRRNPSWKRSA